MNTRPIVVGTLVRFAREGVTSASPAGAVADTLKPIVSDAAWISLGTVESGETQYDEQVREIRSPINGARHLTDALIYGRDLKLNFTLEDYSDVISALRFGHLPLVGGAGGQFNPLERVKVLKGWLKLQETDAATGDNVTVLDAWVFLQLQGALQMGEQGPKPQIMARVLYSALNTGTLLVA
jgi:hypothetical protein